MSFLLHRERRDAQNGGHDLIAGDRMKSCLRLVLPIIAATLVLPQGAIAQDNGGQAGGDPLQFGAWDMQCDPPSGPNRQCALVQDAQQPQNPNLYANVLLLRLDKERLLLRIIAPLGVLVPPGVELRIDGTSVGSTGFSRCHMSGCLADVLVDDALRARLAGGSSASLTLHQTPESSLDFIFRLNGTGGALAALPAPPAKGAGAAAAPKP